MEDLMLSVTDAAQTRIREALSSPETAVRLGAIRGPHGCIHGWQLSLEDEVSSKEDVVFDAQGIKVVVGPELSAAVEDATIDYREDSSAIGFTMDVPNASAHDHGHGRGGGQGCCGGHGGHHH